MCLHPLHRYPMCVILVDLKAHQVCPSVFSTFPSCKESKCFMSSEHLPWHLSWEANTVGSGSFQIPYCIAITTKNYHNEPKKGQQEGREGKPTQKKGWRIFKWREGKADKSSKEMGWMEMTQAASLVNRPPWKIDDPQKNNWSAPKNNVTLAKSGAVNKADL